MSKFDTRHTNRSTVRVEVRALDAPNPTKKGSVPGPPMSSHREKKPDGTYYRPGERLVMNAAKAQRAYQRDQLSESEDENELDDKPTALEKFDPAAEIEAMAARMLSRRSADAARS